MFSPFLHHQLDMHRILNSFHAIELKQRGMNSLKLFCWLTQGETCNLWCIIRENANNKKLNRKWKDAKKLIRFSCCCWKEGVCRNYAANGGWLKKAWVIIEMMFAMMKRKLKKNEKIYSIYLGFEPLNIVLQVFNYLDCS